MSKPWTEITPRERDVLVAQALGYTIYHYDKDVRANCYYMLMDPDFSPVLDGRMGERRFETVAWDDAPPFTTDYNACQLVKQGIARRGLIEKYQDALIDILSLDMQVFNSAIELDPYYAPEVPGNRFEWEGHAYLWLYSQAPPDQCCHAAVKALGVPL